MLETLIIGSITLISIISTRRDLLSILSRKCLIRLFICPRVISMRRKKISSWGRRDIAERIHFQNWDLKMRVLTWAIIMIKHRCRNTWCSNSKIYRKLRIQPQVQKVIMSLPWGFRLILEVLQQTKPTFKVQPLTKIWNLKMFKKALEDNRNLQFLKMPLDKAGTHQQPLTESWTLLTQRSKQT